MPSRHLIMGTSGHVDHGKTALIRMLTGVDTDRLKEEQERGISIELGFAHLDLADGTRLGVVDVPGHERFVKHMLAGVGGIDFVLFVVAADEGVMPQTVEHCQILELLGVERGVVALTKVDLVEPDFIDLVEEDVREFLARTPFAEWPVVRVSSTTAAGKDELVEVLGQVAATVPSRASDGSPRLPIDRVFTVEGFGTVVTGTLWSGSISDGDVVQILPPGIRTRVRQLQIHGARATMAEAGSRTAVALHAVDRDHVTRGDWVMAVDAAPPTWIVDVRLNAVDTTDRAMKQRERVRFHLGASEIFGRVTFFDRDELEPGGSAVAQIRLESPLVALRGDRFVLRWYSPVRTAAGGRVIDPRARKRRRSDADAVQTLDLLDSGTTTDRVLTLLGGCPSRGLTAAEIAAQLGATESEIESATLELSRADHIARLGADRWVGIEWRRQIESIIEEAARGYQERFPLRFGIQLGEVRSRLQGRLEPEAVDAAIQELVQMGRAHVDGDRMRVGNDRLQLPDAERREADRILEMLEGAELSVPATKQLLAAVRTADPQELLVFLAGQGEIVRLTPDLCYTRGQLERLQARVVERFRDHPTMSVADFKGLFGVSRKFAVPLLEYLDQCGITRRSGDSRVPGRRLTTGQPATG